MPKETNRTVVSFELPPEVHAALCMDAKNRRVKSHHRRAKEIIIDYLSGNDQRELRERLGSMEATIAYHGVLIRRVAYGVIVIAAGKDSEQANKWICEHMPSVPKS